MNISILIPWSNIVVTSPSKPKHHSRHDSAKQCDWTIIKCTCCKTFFKMRCAVALICLKVLTFNRPNSRQGEYAYGDHWPCKGDPCYRPWHFTQWETTPFFQIRLDGDKASQKKNLHDGTRSVVCVTYISSTTYHKPSGLWWWWHWSAFQKQSRKEEMA